MVDGDGRDVGERVRMDGPDGMQQTRGGGEADDDADGTIQNAGGHEGSHDEDEHAWYHDWGYQEEDDRVNFGCRSMGGARAA